MAINTFFARIVLQIRFDILTFHFRARLVENRDRTTGHFRDVALFQEDEATGYRQQCQLIGSDKVLTHTQTNHQRAARTGRQQGFRVTGIHDHRAVGTAQLRNSTQHGFTQRTTLFQLPVHQVSNHFGVGFRNKGVATRFQQLTQWFMVFNDAVMHHNNVFRNMGMRVRF